MSSITGCDTERASSKRPRGDAVRAPYRALSARLQVILILALLLCSFVPARAEPLRVLAFGDSLTAASCCRRRRFSAQLERRLRADGFDATVINAGVSGETTAAGLARADFALGEGVDLVILELGANDMLRGVDPKVTSANLDKIVTEIEARKAAVLLAGMVASGNFGPDYKARFDACFPISRRGAACQFIRFS